MMILSSLCLTISTSAQTYESADPQSILLSFYTQQLVSHSASLFASTTASFTFITRLIERKLLNSRRSRTVFILCSGFLLGITICIAARLIMYGYLASAVIAFPKSNYDLVHLQEALMSFFFESYCKIQPILNLLSHYTSMFIECRDPDMLTCILHLLAFAPFSGLSDSIYLGFFFAYVFYYAFCVEVGPKTAGHPSWIGRAWQYVTVHRVLAYFSVPALIGLTMTLGTNARQLDSTRGVSLFASVLLVSWYLVVGIALLIYSKQSNELAG